MLERSPFGEWVFILSHYRKKLRSAGNTEYYG